MEKVDCSRLFGNQFVAHDRQMPVSLGKIQVTAFCCLASYLLPVPRGFDHIPHEYAYRVGAFFYFMQFVWILIAAGRFPLLLSVGGEAYQSFDEIQFFAVFINSILFEICYRRRNPYHPPSDDQSRPVRNNS